MGVNLNLIRSAQKVKKNFEKINSKWNLVKEQVGAPWKLVD